MQEFLINNYQLIKAIHLIAAISWMVGLLYLPRLYVYHSDVKVGGEASEVFKTMERKLLRFIMNPAMIVTLILGLVLIHANPLLMKQGWFHLKLTSLVLLFGCHGYMAMIRKKFLNDERPKSAKFFRYLNEAPTILMIIIVIVVLVQPSF